MEHEAIIRNALMGLVALSVAGAATAQTQSGIDEPIATQIADQGWAGTGWILRIDDHDGTVFVHRDLEPVMAHRGVPFAVVAVEIAIEPWRGVGATQTLRAKDFEVGQHGAQTCGRAIRGAADIQGLLQVSGFMGSTFFQLLHGDFSGRGVRVFRCFACRCLMGQPWSGATCDVQRDRHPQIEQHLGER